MPDEKPTSIGALWSRNKKDGDEYLSGVINGENVVCWRNNYKQAGENSPDWRIYKSRKAEPGKSNDVPF